MAGDPFSNWGGGGSSNAFNAWGGSSYGALPTPKASSGGGHSFLGGLFGGVVHAVESSPVGQFVGFEHSIAQNLWRSPAKTGVGITQLPHALYAGPWALAKLAGHDVTTPSVWLEDPRRYLRDPHTLGGGFLAPLVKQYNEKYQVGNIAKDAAFGNWGSLGHDIRVAGHHEAQDPLGTLLDLTVAGKAGGIAHLRQIEAAAEAGKAPSEFGRLALSPRTLVLRDFPDAEGVPVQLNYQAETSFGRVAQHYMDRLRFGQVGEGGVRAGGIPGKVVVFGHDIINVPFGKAAAFAREDRRARELIHAQNRQLVHAVKQTYGDIPDSQARAIVDVIAEQSREPGIPDPIQNLIDYRNRQITEHERIIRVARDAGQKATVREDITTLKSLKSSVAGLEALDKAAIYRPNPELQTAVEAIRGLGEIPTERAIAEGHLDPMQVEQRALGVQKIMSGGGFVEKHTLGGQVIPDAVKIAEQARARRAMIESGTQVAKARKAMLDSWNSVVHHTQTRTLKNLYEEYQGRIKNLRTARRTPGHLPPPPPAGAPEALPPIVEPGGPIAFRMRLPKLSFYEAQQKGLDVGEITQKRGDHVVVKMTDEQLRTLEQHAKSSGRSQNRALANAINDQRHVVDEAHAQSAQKLRFKKDPTTGGYYVEGTSYHIQQDPESLGYLSFHGDELLPGGIHKELKDAKAAIEKDVRGRRVEQLRAERLAAEGGPSALDEPVTGRQLGAENPMQTSEDVHRYVLERARITEGPIAFETGKKPVTSTGAAPAARTVTVKGKTFKQYAEEVYPKRTEMGGAVGRALLKHEVLVDDFLKKQKAYQAARDEWQSRRPPLTETGKGRQHHTIATPRVEVGAALRGGRSYEDLQAANEAAVEAYQAGDVTGHNPLAQYGMPFRAPHLPATADSSLARIYTRAKAVLTQQSANEAWQRNKYVLWQRGMIANSPEVFTIDFLRQMRWFATQDHFERWVIPQTGALDPKLATNGGKHDDEFYVKTKPSATVPRDVQQAQKYFHDLSVQQDDALARAQHDYVTQDLQDAAKLKPGEEDAAAWVARMNDMGIRRISGDVARSWQIDTRPSSLLRRMVLRNGVNQLWRFFLLGIKPAWSVANAMTNETLVGFRYLFTKGGGTAFYNSMVDTFGAAKAAEMVKNALSHDKTGVGLINMRNLMQADPRLADLFAGSFGKQLDAQLQHVGSLSDQWNRSIASKTARLLVPYTKDWGPIRLLRGFAEANYRFNIHAENAARAAAAQAEIARVTGKMVKTTEDLQAFLKHGTPEQFDKIRAGVLDSLGDYSNLGSFEREWVVTFAPFYPWFKTIMGITAKWVTRHPERLWGLGVMAHAFTQAQNQDYQLGIPLPYFAADSIPAGKPQAGEQRIITDRAFNPLVTPIDILNTARALTGDPNAQPSDLGLALMGPAAQFGYVAMTGRDPFYGGTYSGPLAGAPAPIRGLGSLLQTPQYRTIQQFGGIPGLVPAYKSKVYNTPKGGSFIPGVSEADWVAIEQYWGVPVRYANLQNLKDRALAEQGHPVSTTKAPAMPAYNPAPTTSGSFSNWGGG